MRWPSWLSPCGGRLGPICEEATDHSPCGGHGSLPRVLWGPRRIHSVASWASWEHCLTRAPDPHGQVARTEHR
eukprot:7686411-Pyramimonas_sp.AAC.1